VIPFFPLFSRLRSLAFYFFFNFFKEIQGHAIHDERLKMLCSMKQTAMSKWWSTTSKHVENSLIALNE
jgi:hypothetical protein